MIHFKPITVEDKTCYESFLYKGHTHGCNYSFANMFMWGEQSLAVLHGHLAIFSHYQQMQMYPFPLGNGDTKAVIDAIIADAGLRGIPCKITVMGEDEKNLLQKLYPEQFIFHSDRDSFDYVYDINCLADLKGRKYHRKKNHYNGFLKAFPAYRVEPLTDKHLPAILQMTKDWFDSKSEQNPDSDYQMEEIALKRALQYYKELDMEGLILMHHTDIFAFTLGSRLSKNTFDVHFEKARADIPGAYAAINCEFARYIRSKYPEIEFLNREEDLGIEGLRKAKESYQPHHMTIKYYAELKENTIL